MGRKKHIHTIGVRCTDEELQQLQEECKKRKISRSEFLRRRIFLNNHQDIPVEVMKNLEELQNSNVQIGSEITQYLRSAPDLTTKENLDILIKLLEKIDYKYQKIYLEIKNRKEEPDDGDHKTGETERSIRGPPGSASAEQYPLYL